MTGDDNFEVKLRNDEDEFLIEELSIIEKFENEFGVDVSSYVGDLKIGDEAAKIVNRELIEDFTYAQIAKVGLAVGKPLMRKTDKIIIYGKKHRDGYFGIYDDGIIEIFYRDERNFIKRLFSIFRNNDNLLQKLELVANPKTIIHEEAHLLTLDDAPARAYYCGGIHHSPSTPLSKNVPLREVVATVIRDVILDIYTLEHTRKILKRLRQNTKLINSYYNKSKEIIELRGFPYFVEGIREIDPEDFEQFYNEAKKR
jgi:hypothetical protein